MKLNIIRSKIDKIDEKILKTIAKRMKLIPYVAKYKKENNIARYQPKREKEILKNRRELAKKFGINPDLIEKIIKSIIKDAHRIEKEIIGK